MTNPLRELLNKKRDELSEKYRKEDFANNPNGYHVTPGLNEYTTTTAFDAGADAMLDLLMPVVERAERIKAREHGMCLDCVEIREKLTELREKLK